MPKKTRKMKQRAAMRRAYQGPEQDTGAPLEDSQQQEAVVRMRPAVASSRAATPLTFDYTHIYNDLKRIALFAGFFFAVLVVLSYVIK